MKLKPAVLYSIIGVVAMVILIVIITVVAVMTRSRDKDNVDDEKESERQPSEQSSTTEESSTEESKSTYEENLPDFVLRTLEKPASATKSVTQFQNWLASAGNAATTDVQLIQQQSLMEDDYETEYTDENSKFFLSGGLQPFVKREVDICLRHPSVCSDAHLTALLRIYGVILHRTFPDGATYRRVQESERVKRKLTTDLFVHMTAKLKPPVNVHTAFKHHFVEAIDQHGAHQTAFGDGVLSPTARDNPIPTAVAFLFNTDFVSSLGRDRRVNLNAFFRRELQTLCQCKDADVLKKIKDVAEWWAAVRALAPGGAFHVSPDLKLVITSLGIPVVINSVGALAYFCEDYLLNELEKAAMSSKDDPSVQLAITAFTEQMARLELAIDGALGPHLQSPPALRTYVETKYSADPVTKTLFEQRRTMLQTPRKYSQEIQGQTFRAPGDSTSFFDAPYERAEQQCSFLIDPSFDLLRAPMSEVRVTLRGPEADFRDRFEGIFWGAIVGDAYGAAWEFTTRQVVLNGGHAGKPPLTLVSQPPQYYNGAMTHAPGIYTDDTSAALSICAMYLERGTVDCHDLMAKFRNWRTNLYMNFSAALTDFGGTTGSSLDSGTPKPSVPSNGGVMRQWPNVLGNAWRPGQVCADAARATGTLTHCHSIARDAAVILALVVYELLHGATKEDLQRPAYLLEHYPDFWQHRPPVLKANHATIVDLLREEEEGLGCAYLYPHVAPRTHRKGAGFAAPAVRGALEAFFNTTSFMEGLAYILLKGWDQDTTGSIYGSIAGAFYKKSQIPPWMIQDVSNSPALHQLVDAMYARAKDPSAPLNNLAPPGLPSIIAPDGKVLDFNPGRLPPALHGNNANIRPPAWR